MTKFLRSDICKNCIDCNKRTPLFHRLTDEELQILNIDRYEVKYKPGELMVKQGMPANHLVSVTTGLAKLYVEGVKDKTILLEIVKPWQVFGGPGIYVDNRYHYTATALEEVTACFIDSKNIKKLIRKNPDFAEDYIRGCSTRSAQMIDRLISLTQKQMHGRIADALLYLKNVFEDNKFEMKLTKQDIADLSSMTKDSALRILKDLQSDNIIVSSNGTMEIVDERRLVEIAQHG